MLTTITVVLVVTMAYWVVSQIWPYARCRRCSGGKLRTPSGKTWRKCPRCGGSGERERLLYRSSRRR